MSRTLKYKKIYILLIILAVFAGIALSIQLSNSIIAFLIVPILLLVQEEFKVICTESILKEEN